MRPTVRRQSRTPRCHVAAGVPRARLYARGSVDSWTTVSDPEGPKSPPRVRTRPRPIPTRHRRTGISPLRSRTRQAPTRTRAHPIAIRPVPIAIVPMTPTSRRPRRRTTRLLGRSGRRKPSRATAPSVTANAPRWIEHARPESEIGSQIRATFDLASGTGRGTASGRAPQHGFPAKSSRHERRAGWMGRGRVMGAANQPELAFGG